MRPKSNFTDITTEVCPVPSTDTSSLLVFPAASVDVSPLGPVALPSPLKSPPCTLERAVLPDIAFPPPGEGEIEEDILEQILPEENRPVSRSDSFQALEPYSQKTRYSKRCYRSNGRCCPPSTRQMTSRRKRVLPPTPPSPAWNRYNRPYSNRRNFTRSSTLDLIKLRSVVRRRSESPPSNKPRKH